MRADGVFGKPEICEPLGDRSVKYAIHIAANERLVGDLDEWRTRPVGRPSHNPVIGYKGFLSQAESGRRRDGW